MAFTQEDILKALSTVQDPDLRKDLVSLNMIHDLKVTPALVTFKVVLTTPACPLKEQIEQDCLRAVQAVTGPNVDIVINMDADVTSMRGEKRDLLPGVKNIVVVASGKGGVGKSTVAVNLALALSRNGAKVGLIDADIHGPSIPTMLGLRGARPNVQEIDGKHYILPLTYQGIKVLSIGFMVDDKQAVVWRGPMISSALRQFVTDTIWGELDYMIIDTPPGTGDIHLTLAQTLPVTGSIIVTTPQEVALADARKAVGMFTMNQIKIPVIGVIENMAYFTPPELPNNKYYIFGKGGGQKLADEYDIPFIGQLPIVEGIREGGDNGVPAAIGNDKISEAAFSELATQAARYIAIRNENLKPTEKVEITT